MDQDIPAGIVHRTNTIRRCRRIAFILIISALTHLAAISAAVAGAGKSRHVLFLNSYHPGYSWSDGIQNGFLERINSPDLDIEVSVEYLDTRRFNKPEILKALAGILKAKYSGYHFDLAVVSDNAAFEFAIDHRALLFPNAPIVFCGYNNFNPEIIKGMTDITGVNEEVDVKRLIETALHILPAIKTLAFILSTGDVSSKAIAAKIEKTVIPAYEKHFRIVLLKDASMDRIGATLARLPAASALFLVGQTSDSGQGRALTPTENGWMISGASPVPVFTLWKFHLNTGVLGGRILSGRYQGRAAGDMALQILNGKSAGSIPVMMTSPTKNIFDYKVMQRFKIAPESLPPDSIILNRTGSFYTEHKRIVWTTLGVITALVAFILVLSLNIVRRIRAEKDLQKHRDHLEMLVRERTAELTVANRSLGDSEERFRCLSDAAFEGIALNENGIIVEVNRACGDMFGYGPSEMINRSAIDFISPEERKRVNNKIISGFREPFMTSGLRKDGSAFPIEIRGSLLPYKGRSVRVAAIRDHTRQRQAEEEIKTLQGILPICLYCKKIRNDKGYWEQVDIYIRRYSEADVSHGICPECLKIHYPEQYDKIMSRRKSK